MRAYGNVGAAGVGGNRLDVPIEPRPISAAEQAARQARRDAAIAAGPRPPQKQASRLAHFWELAPRTQASSPAKPTPPSSPAAQSAPKSSLVFDELCERCCGKYVTAWFMRRTGKRSHPPCEAVAEAQSLVTADSGSAS